MALPPFHPYLPGLRQNPYPIYRAYREKEPIHWSQPAQSWVLFRYADISRVLMSRTFGREKQAVIPGEPLSEMLAQWMLLRNPPDHTRLRALVARAFTPKMVKGVEGQMLEVTTELLDSWPGEGTVDFMEQFASRLPVRVVAEILGVGSEAYIQFRDWINDLSAAIDLNYPPEAVAPAQRACVGLQEYLRGVVRARRANPGPDLVSSLIAAEEEGDRLTEEELISMCILVLGAGHETTVNLIGNGLLALLQHPEQTDRIRADPSLMKGAVEELLRYDSSVQHTFRVALEDVEIDGVPIRAGQPFILALGSANRDPAQFEDPDTLKIDRADCKHVSFGLGIHFCLGATVARTEAAIALNEILRRFPDLEIATEELDWRERVTFRGLSSLPLRYSARKS